MNAGVDDVVDGVFNIGRVAASHESFGGGVYVYNSFRMGGGIIYGSNAATGLKNTGSSASALATISSQSQYGTFSGGSFYPSGNLTTSDTTIRVINGNLLTE